MSTTTRGLAVALVASGLALALGGCNLIPTPGGAGEVDVDTLHTAGLLFQYGSTL